MYSPAILWTTIKDTRYIHEEGKNLESALSQVCMVGQPRIHVTKVEDEDEVKLAFRTSNARQ